MISTTYLSQPIFILPYSPDWGSADPTASLEKLTFDSAGMSNREEREPLASSLRWSMSFTMYLQSNWAPTFAAAMDALDTRPICCPFWPSEQLASSRVQPSVIGALTVFWEPLASDVSGWGNYEITTGGNPIGFTPSAACRKAPLFWGRFDTLPTRTVITAGDEETVSIALVENGPPSTALDVRAVALIPGSSINGTTPPRLTVPFEWGGNTSQVDLRITHAKIGFGREDADDYYPQVARKHETLNFTLMGTAEVNQLLYLFKQQGGSVNPWWLATADVSGAGYIYGRFYSDKLTLSWQRSGWLDEMATAQVEFLTLPTEISIPSGETFGTTIGPMAGRIFLYEVFDGTSYFRFTSYESDLVGPGSNTFVHQSLTHGTITEELNLLTHQCSLDIQHWANGVFARLHQNPAAAPLTVTIYEGLLSSPTIAAAIFTGQAMSPKIVGQKMTITLKGIGESLLAVMGPRSILQIGCNAVLGDSRCTVDVAAFSYTRTLSSISGAIATLAPGAGLPPVGYFQNGYATRVVGGITQRFLINDSYNTGGNITLVLVGPCLGASGGESWVLTPGCDGKYATCVAKFSNGVNHRGCPNLPDKNPSMFVVNTAKGTKK